MFLGYNTNGLAHHHIDDAFALLAQHQFQAIGITIDHYLLNPFSLEYRNQLKSILRLIDRYQFRTVIETGARYLLSHDQKHEPTMMTSDAKGREKRVQFLYSAIDTACMLGSDCVSFWSGILHDQDVREDQARDRLVESLSHIVDYAEQKNVRLAFEPEPGMFIDTMERWDRLCEKITHPYFQLTIDVGHLHCNDELPISSVLEKYKDELINIHIEDMNQGIHEHLMFGEGTIDFEDVFTGLRNANYQNGVYVELSRHSHMAPSAVEKSAEFLSQFIQ